jgi:hypothetical protein
MRKNDMPDQGGSVGGRPKPAKDAAPQGLVFDFSGRQSPDIRDLSLLLTARMLADRDDRPVWVKALPFKTWEVLHTLGLANLFRLFPSSGDPGN